jgi:hypothetical protein
MDHTGHHKNNKLYKPYKFLLSPNCYILDKLINQFNKFLFLEVGCLGVNMNLFFLLKFENIFSVFGLLNVLMLKIIF